eukprot:gb/GECG01011780.1/.p1 GENE.gb/GECG01011780.1/~~gb/GECG01011780.1/.p1  ORF type:complete len:120 (+),score=18.15 gb/GECG01011780.1/:1-360(+)
MEGAEIAVVSIPVSDQQDAKRFYTEVLKFELVKDEKMDESSNWIQVRPTGSSATFSLWATNSIHPTCIVLEVTNLETAVKELRQQGVEVSEPKEQHWGTFSMLKDPDGNTIVLKIKCRD